MFFFFSSGDKLKDSKYLGIRLCGNCRSFQHYYLYKKVSQFSLYFIPIFSWGKEYFIGCGRCKAGYAIEEDEALRLIEKYKNEFALKYKLWIKNIVSHFKFYFGIGDVNKSMYHLIRIKHIVENYKTTGAFSLDLSKEVHEWILEFKKAQNKAPYRQTLYEALVYLENIKEE